jgi:hypothetical protein
LSPPNPALELPEEYLPSAATVLASAVDLADTLAYAHGKGPEAIGLPEFMNYLPGSLYNKVALGKLVHSSLAQQVIAEQSLRQTCDGLEGDFAENAFSARPKSENCPFLATPEARPDPQN